MVSNRHAQIIRSCFGILVLVTCIAGLLARTDNGSALQIEIRRAIPVEALPDHQVVEIRRAIPIAEPVPGSWLPAFGGYTGHIVGRGEGLKDIARLGGSTPQVIASYNSLTSEPAAGRGLIVPNLNGLENRMQSKPFIIERGPTGTSRIALTLDAGSTAEPLPRVLEALRQRHLTITFFVTGCFVRENPEMVRRIAADGHEFGNHSLSHPDLRHVDDRRLLREFAETERLLLATAGASTRPFFRPPFGAYNDHVLVTAENLGFVPVYWTLDSLDSVGAKKNSEFLYQRVTGHLSAQQLRGAIILMHVDSMGTAEAMPRILDRYAAMGLQVCKLSRLLNDA